MTQSRARLPGGMTPSAINTTLCVLAILLFSSLGGATAYAQEVPELQITSKHYIVIDATTGEVFAQRGANDRVAIASLTKVFTAIEAIETAPLEQTLTTHTSDLFGDSSTTMGFGPDETFTLEDLLYGMMLPSGNDAAHAIARELGSSEDVAEEEAVSAFVERINERLRNMGLTDTNVVNPHGWGVPEHYSSAHDLATFTMYALQYPGFVDLISTSTYITSDGLYALSNTNKMLNLYNGIIGGKTGYDDDAGWCLIEVARRDGSTMISVTLDGVAPDDWYDDNRVLLDYAFTQKANRLTANRPISGETLSFLDPDAAFIAERVESGASVGLLRVASDSGSTRNEPARLTQSEPTSEEAAFPLKTLIVAFAAIALLLVAFRISSPHIQARFWRQRDD
ncbi:MAG: D-alanyl-D-alanine carboxypeptidase [Chloroflexia bacterium]|nr:D-alanyl-D-alanine carboxypeptidase [Chloroflexia bacterium]